MGERHHEQQTPPGCRRERAREAAVAGERERAIQEVHEAIGRSLGSLLLHLDRADKATAGGSPSIQHIDYARVLAHEALFETRRTVLGLAPSSLAGKTVEEAVRGEIDWVGAGYPIDITLLVTGDHHELAPVVTHQLFMVIQEAVANVVAHARATTCRVGIFYDTTCITAVVEDNGRGFERPDTQSGTGSVQGSRLGLHGMAARAHYLRGDLHVTSMPGWGTSIRAQVPYSSNDASRERWKVLVACTQPPIRAGLVRLLETFEPSVQILGEQGTLEGSSNPCLCCNPTCLSSTPDSSDPRR